MKTRLRTLAVGIAMAGAMTLMLLLSQIGSADAAGTPTYGVTQNPSNPVTGYTQVVSETQILKNGTATTLTGTLTVATGTITININLPGGDFNTSATPDNYELILSTCSNPATDVTGINGYTAYACFGVEILDTTNASIYETALNSPMILTASGPMILPQTANILAMYNPLYSLWNTIPGNITGGININIASDPDFALLAQSTTSASSTTGTVSGATTATTGKPFIGEELGAGAIGIAAIFGAVMLYKTKKKRA